ncbi:MAG: hypothetical protein BWK73_27950 [Thiothrix lacustris]|uniref:Uncharacterized protein n=1 Tax=Thiothrix lacustris TaxID=525917 RepID=A0A1Y1QKD9_9GAMM|nr:MAG: hypothetical protein BWK73_27950 [Thiothrix lacustris]
MNHPFIIALAKQGAYGLLALGLIAACGVAHLFNAISSASLFTAVMPVFGFVACIAYGLLCYASRSGSLLKLLFVVGAFSTFWIQ